MTTMGCKRQPGPRRPLRKVAKNERRRKELRLDQFWAADIRTAANGRCEKCGIPGDHAHHIVSRRNKATRHDQENGVFLCFRCHLWAHNQPTEFKSWLSCFRKGLTFSQFR